MRPAPNGRGTGARRMPHAQKVNAGKPVGAPVKGLTRREVAVWNELLDCWPFIDLTHRKWFSDTVRLVAAIDIEDEYFRKRTAEFVAAGKEPALSFLGDDGERHPRMIKLHEMNAKLREAFVGLERIKKDVGVPTTAEQAARHHGERLPASRRAEVEPKEAKAERKLREERQRYFR